MKLANHSVGDVKKLLDSYLDADFLENGEWSFRLTEQAKIGAALRKSVFGDRDVDVGKHVRFAPVIEDPDDLDGNDAFVDFVARVPWAMLTSDNDPRSQFLAFGYAKPVAITVNAAPLLGEKHRWHTIRQTAAPRLLLVMPEVKHKTKADNTGAAQHRDALMKILGRHYDEQGAKDNIRAVRTIAEYTQALIADKFYPEIIYFYGHGASSENGTQFQFETDGGKEDWCRVDEVHVPLRKIVDFNNSPPLVWFNACQGAAANQESAMRIFAETASCVVAMRTVVRMDASRQLAEKALKSIIVDGFEPPVAIREALSNCPPDWTRSGHWASVAVAEQYVYWTALGNTKATAQANDAVGDFPSRVDRTEALENIKTVLTRDLSQLDGAIEPSVLLWVGSDDERPVLFGERTRDHIKENFQGFRPIYIDVDLQQGVRPGGISELKAQLRAAVMIALDGKKTTQANTADILDAIGRVSPGAKSVLSFFHGPLTSKHAELIPAYIGLWTSICRELSLLNNSPRIVLAFGFVDEVGEPLVLPEGRDAIRLGAVPPAEIRTHLSRYRLLYDVDITELDQATTEVMQETGGVFAKLVDVLRRLAKFTSESTQGETNGRL